MKRPLKQAFLTTNIAKTLIFLHKTLIYNMLSLFTHSPPRNKGIRKPAKSPILTIINHRYGIEHVKKLCKNVPPSVPPSFKKRTFEHKKGGTQAYHNLKCRPKMETLHKFYSNTNQTATYHPVSGAIG